MSSPAETNSPLTTEELQSAIKQLEPMVIRGIVRASFTASRGGQILLRREDGGRFKYLTRHPFTSKSTEEFPAHLITIFELGGEALINAYASPEYGCYEGSDLIEHFPLSEARLEVAAKTA
jgi:hypothetical protein